MVIFLRVCPSETSIAKAISTADLSGYRKNNSQAEVQIGKHLSTRPVGKTRVVHSICHRGNHTPSANHSLTASKLKKRESHVGNKASRSVRVPCVYHDNVKVKLPTSPSPPCLHLPLYTLWIISPKRLTRTSERRPVLQKGTLSATTFIVSLSTTSSRLFTYFFTFINSEFYGFCLNVFYYSLSQVIIIQTDLPK